MTMNRDRSLPHQSGRKGSVKSGDSVSAIDRLLNWALGPSTEVCDTQLANPRCSRTAALVIDASGSMEDTDWAPSRLDGAKKAAKTYCDRLAREDPNARITIIAYGSTAKTMCRLTRAASLDALHQAIDNITILGRTNIKAGLSEAIKAIPDEALPCQVVLLSDGHNTERCPLGTAASLRKKAVVECVGIGGRRKDVDESLMKKIASKYPDGKKRYRWIGSKERLVKEFEKLAGRVMRP